jgi:NADPH:quinone reductase-like Zn-dependent oxidoreductase
MHAVVFPAPETVSVERVPDPTPQRDEVVVQVAASGL